MIPALWIGKTGLDAQQTHVGVISNNLANVNTVGFKRGAAVFEDLLYQNIRQPGGQTTETTQLPTGLMLGTGVRVVATNKLFSRGNLIVTDNPLDVAINGRGFFQVTQPDGTMSYSKNGQFQVDSQGRLVNNEGLVLSPAITVPENATQLTIGNDGTVTVNIPGQTAPQSLGTITIADFVNPAGLEPLGQNLYKETAGSGTANVSVPGQNGSGSLIQSSLEASNVNVVEELVNLIEAQRAYEMNSKAIATVDGMLQFISQTL